MLRLVLTAVGIASIILTIVVHHQLTQQPFPMILFSDLAAVGTVYVIFKSITRGPEAGLRALTFPFVKCSMFFSFIVRGYARIKGRVVAIGRNEGDVCYFSVIRDCLVTISLRRPHWWIVRPALKRWKLKDTIVTSVEIIQMGTTHRITIANQQGAILRGNVWRLDLLPNVVGASPECIARTVRRHFMIKVVGQIPYLMIMVIVLLVRCL